MTEMLLGRVLVPDIANPRPEDVDVEFMRYRMGTIRRFNGHRLALYVGQHQRLCGLIASRMGYSSAVVEWAGHHDDHEFATGDIATPLQRVFGMDAIHALQDRWDIAICGALGIEVPTDEVRRHVAAVDAMALVIEWDRCLHRDPAELGVGKGIMAAAQLRRYSGLLVEVV